VIFQVVPGLPFVHPSERDLLNRVCRLGGYYMHIQSFISDQMKGIFRFPQHGQTGDSNKGLYLISLAYSLDAALNDYRKQLVKLEQKVQ